MLLILDNLEHLLEAGGAIRDLIGRTERLHVLVTSRARLQLAGEREFPVPPLDLPPLRLQRRSPRLRRDRPVRRSRACGTTGFRARHSRRTARPSWPSAGGSTGCRWQSNSPRRGSGSSRPTRSSSAWARAWTSSRRGIGIGPTASARSSTPSRGRSICLKSRSSGSFDASAYSWAAMFSDATAIVAEPGETDDEVLDRLAQLVDQSLVVPVDSSGDPRFTMLETIRESARGPAGGSGRTRRDQPAARRGVLGNGS